MVKKKEILLMAFLFAIVLATFPLSIVKIADNKNKEGYGDSQIAALKTSVWQPGFNYSIIDNYPYSWIEINETGTNITDTFHRGASQNLDDGSTGISFSGQGWNFTFYGTEYNTINVSTNGWMSFSGQGELWQNNVKTIPQDCTLGGSEFHNDAVFLFHTDINLDTSIAGGGSVFYEFKGAAPNRYLVVEYFQVHNYTYDVPHLVGDFEAIFYENGDIKFQYKLVRDLIWLFPYAVPVVGLDHGDLINYNNYTNNWTNTFAGDVEKLAVYFRLNRNYTMDTNADYNWYEIRLDGTHMSSLSNEDDWGENITFIGRGWNFTFYDTEYSDINVSSNGWMSFTNLGHTNGWLDDIPDFLPENIDCVSLLCTDIDLSLGGDVYYYFGGSEPNRYLIIEYYRAYDYDTEELIGDFQVIFYESGNIKFQYKTVNNIAMMFPIIGLDHGDLIYYNSYIPTLPITSKAIKFIIDASAEDLVDFTATIPPPAPAAGDDDDDDDDGEEVIPGFDLYLILLSSILALIAVVKKLRKHNK